MITTGPLFSLSHASANPDLQLSMKYCYTINKVTKNVAKILQKCPRYGKQYNYLTVELFLYFTARHVHKI